MTSHTALSPPANSRNDGLAAEITKALGHPVPAEWQQALHAAPRHLFLPQVLWLRDGNGGYAPCDRGSDPERWWAAAYSDAPLVVQFTEEEDGYQVPSSSASAPSTMIRMLEQAELGDGMRVLEIGAGTGFHAALLSARLGSERVVSVEIDSELTAQARTNLAAAGHAPTVRCADGAQGWAAGGPYDRIISTCAVRAVPPAWLEQTRPGGRLVIPWNTAWVGYGTLTLTRHPDGSASGPFAPFGSYMVMRGQRSGIELGRDVLRAGQVPQVSHTTISPWAVAGNDLDALFAIGLAVPDVWHSWDTETDAAHTRLWLADDDATSWATVDYDGHQTDTFRVSQHGPRRLWDAVEAAHRSWEAAGRPSVARYGLTVMPDGTATASLNFP
ncbi:methyltransferase domain-containing protein [Streptomyces sp. HK10]|uniref:methyltransferase domain-containing protein n=1 Tax=Streptomyces sp. HK10 TaxID=3373255 RepID=UPI003748D2A7